MEVYVTIIGIAVQTALFLLGGYAMVLRNDWSNKALKIELMAMQKQLERLAEVITTQAVQTTRIDNLYGLFNSVDKRVEDLRRGNGYITGRHGTDGEYP
jgi:NADH:ubiquinone oxidoreductase subunit D